MNGKNESEEGKAMSHIRRSQRRQEMDSVHQDHHGNLAIQPREETQLFPHQLTRDLSSENYHYRNHYQYNTTNPYRAFNTPQFVNTYQNYNSPMGHVVQPPNYQSLTQYHASNPYVHVSNQHKYVYPYNSKESNEFRLPSDQSSYSNIGPQYHMPCYQNSFLYHSTSPNVFDHTPCYPYHNSFQHQVANDPRTFQHQTTNIGHSFHTRINQFVHAEHPNHDKRMSNNQLEQDSRYGETQVYDERLQIRSRTFVTNEPRKCHANEKVVPDEMNEKFQILHKTFLSDSIIGIAITSDENKVIRNWERQYTMGTATSSYNGGKYKQQSRKKSTKYQRLGYYYCKGKKGRNGGCERTYIIVRFHQWLALYSSKVQHTENCNVAPRIKNAPKEMIRNAYRNRDDVNPGRTAYNSIDLDKVDSEYPNLKIKTGHGKKRAIDSINRHMKNSDKQCNNKKEKMIIQLMK